MGQILPNESFLNTWRRLRWSRIVSMDSSRQSHFWPTWFHPMRRWEALWMGRQKWVWYTLIYQLHWTGHVIRMPDNQLKKQVLYFQLANSHSSRSKQMKRFKNTLQANLNKCDKNIYIWETWTLNHPQWCPEVQGINHFQQTYLAMKANRWGRQRERSLGSTSSFWKQWMQLSACLQLNIQILDWLLQPFPKSSTTFLSIGRQSSSYSGMPLWLTIAVPWLLQGFWHCLPWYSH